MRPNTKAFYGESIGNPRNDVLDIEGVSKVAHDNGVPLIIDNTVATPYRIRPLEWGADIVALRPPFIGGHGTAIGGVIVDGGSFDFSQNDKFPQFTEPDPSYHGLAYWPALGAGSYIIKALRPAARDLGAATTPFNLVPLPPGARDAELADGAPPVQRHQGGGVPRRPRPGRVGGFAGLASSPWKARADKYSGGKGYGSVPAFVIEGAAGRPAEVRRGPELHSHLANLGDVRSLVIQPSSTTHSQLTEEEQRSTGVHPGLIRLSVGIESIEDILADLDKGFAAAAG